VILQEQHHCRELFAGAWFSFSAETQLIVLAVDTAEAAVGKEYGS